MCGLCASIVQLCFRAVSSCIWKGKEVRTDVSIYAKYHPLPCTPQCPTLPTTACHDVRKRCVSCPNARNEVCQRPFPVFLPETACHTRFLHVTLGSTQQPWPQVQTHMPSPALCCPWSTARGRPSHKLTSPLTRRLSDACDEPTPVTSYESTVYDDVRAHAWMPQSIQHTSPRTPSVCMHVARLLLALSYLLLLSRFVHL